MADNIVIKKLAQKITKELRYSLVGSDWGRLHTMVKRYGEDAVEVAIGKMGKWDFPIYHIMNTIEKQSQKYVKESKSVKTISQLIEEKSIEHTS